jgi:hypothetical protein
MRRNRMTMEPPMCSTSGCKNQARAAIRTIRSTRERIVSTVDYDNRTAPKTFEALCKQCTINTITELINVLVDSDVRMPGEPTETQELAHTEEA